jgi:hypothetical protein
MDWAVIGAFLRHALTAVGAWAVSKGWVDGAMMEQLVGAVLVFGSFIWSLVQKKSAQAQITKAEVAPAQPPTTKLAA